MTEVGIEAPPGWDEAAVRSPAGHVMQSAAWAKIREAQGWRPEFHQLGSPALPVALVLWRPLPGGRSIAYVPRGPILGSPEQLEPALAKLAGIARDRRAIFLKVDPEIDPKLAAEPLRAAGFRRGPDIQPVVATLELDLGPDEDALFAALEKDTRWSVRQAEKRGVSIREAIGEDDLRALYDLYAETGQRAGFITRTWDYYRRMWGRSSRQDTPRCVSQKKRESPSRGRSPGDAASATSTRAPRRTTPAGPPTPRTRSSGGASSKHAKGARADSISAAYPWT